MNNWQIYESLLNPTVVSLQCQATMDDEYIAEIASPTVKKNTKLGHH